MQMLLWYLCTDGGATDWWILAFEPQMFHRITCQVLSRRSSWDFAVGSAVLSCGGAQQGQRWPELHSRSSGLLQDLGFKETQCMFQTSHSDMHICCVLPREAICPPTQRDDTERKTVEHFVTVVYRAPWWSPFLIHAGEKARKARESRW